MQADIPAFLALGIGALLLWAAIRGQNPLQLLRDTLAGKPGNPRAAKPVAPPQTGGTIPA